MNFVTIHGHFYQPCRENPWTGDIPVQPSAQPFRDWNERITAECYGPNAHAPILGPDGQVAEIVNNYSRISFNFGHTLLSWLERHAPAVHSAIVAADRESRLRFSGHGSAIAQAYGHMILPLSSDQDRNTQVLWGKRDFERRFGRAPEGMWLPETAVSYATLETLVDHGIRFTILSPYQAFRVRENGVWRDATGARIDPRRPYLCRLPSGRRITLFFYDAPASQGVAFEGLLHNGERLAGRLLNLIEGDAHGMLAHIATDGESYGHHHKHGEMALAYALRVIESHDGVRLTNYGEYLAMHPPTDEMEIADPSAWSCAHGIGRWKEDCGCETGGEPGWNQAWRAPLREAIDWLRDEIAEHLEGRGAQLVRDPWAARNDYIDYLAQPSYAAAAELHSANGGRGEVETLITLLEMSRQAMLMQTSCGWFFNDMAGIETIQNLTHAARAIQLCAETGGRDLEEEFLRRLEGARSNRRAEGTGRNIYVRYVKPLVRRTRLPELHDWERDRAAEAS